MLSIHSTDPDHKLQLLSFCGSVHLLFVESEQSSAAAVIDDFFYHLVSIESFALCIIVSDLVSVNR
jgi:hypothetical protein